MEPQSIKWKNVKMRIIRAKICRKVRNIIRMLLIRRKLIVDVKRSGFEAEHIFRGNNQKFDHSKLIIM